MATEPSAQRGGVVAVLGDLHGHLTLGYRLLRRWEDEHKETIDLILQVGDLQAYPPNPFRLDEAVMRFARHDPDELGFVQYYMGSSEAEEILGATRTGRSVGANMYFIKGNHDDYIFLHEVLDRHSDIAPVDRYGRILYVRSGAVLELDAGGARLRVGFLGGVPPRGRAQEQPSAHFTRAELRKLEGACDELDVLLTHEVPIGTSRFRGGSRQIKELLWSCSPQYHFCGHRHEPGQWLDVQGNTESWLLNSVGFRVSDTLNAGCFGILRWQGIASSSFDLVNESWLAEYTKENYRHL